MVGEKKAGQVILHLFFILLVIITFAPLLLLISSSLTSETSLLSSGYNFFPKVFSLEAYEFLFKGSSKIIRACGITFLVTIVGTVVNISLTLLMAYPLSRKELPGRSIVAFYIFFTMLFNGGLVPIYMMWTQTFHIKNTIFALIIPRLMLSPFYVIMMRSYIQSTIPDSLIEAARLDGCNEFYVLTRIVVPLSKPMIATVSLMVALAYWNDWQNSLYFVTDESLFSIQAMLNTIMTNIQYLATNADVGGMAGSMIIPSAGVRMALAVIGVVPILCVYPFFQKYFVKGIVVGGVKG